MLYKEAGLTKSRSILDVGHGSGDSLLLLAKDYTPSLLHGVTSAKGHALRAQTRLKGLKYAQNTRVYHDDAVAFLKRSNEPMYDFIFALDCAYHFRTRRDFLKLCFTRLRPGGKVALIDLVASHPYPSSASNNVFTPSPTLPRPKHHQAPLSTRIKHTITTMLTGVPLGNLIPIDTYQTHLVSAGFEDITIKDTSHLVFPGFAQVLKAYGLAEESTWRGGGALQGIALRSFGSTVQEWSKGGDVGMVRSVVVVAVKP
jgi:predicted O-methyltransferase YrrM